MKDPRCALTPQILHDHAGVCWDAVVSGPGGVMGVMAATGGSRRRRGAGTSKPRASGSRASSYTLVRGPSRAAAAPALDPAQQQVVDHEGGPLLVLAGPGTGKTTTIVEAVVVAHRARPRPGAGPRPDVRSQGGGRAARTHHRAAGARDQGAARPHVPLLRVRRAAPRGRAARRADAAAADRARSRTS